LRGRNEKRGLMDVGAVDTSKTKVRKRKKRAEKRAWWRHKKDGGKK